MAARLLPTRHSFQRRRSYFCCFGDPCGHRLRKSFPDEGRRSDDRSRWSRSSPWRSGIGCRRSGRSSEALFQDHDPLEPAAPFTHEQRAGPQTQAFSGLRRAAVERSADAILFPRAKDSSDRFVETAEGVRLEPTGQHPYQKPAWKMGGRFAAEVDAPLTAQPIEIEAIKIGNDPQNRGIERRRGARGRRHLTLRCLPGVGSRAGHLDYAACVAFRLNPRPSIASRGSTVRSPI